MWCLGEESPGDRVTDGSWDWGCQWMEITSPGGSPPFPDLPLGLPHWSNPMEPAGPRSLVGVVDTGQPLEQKAGQRRVENGAGAK